MSTPNFDYIFPFLGLLMKETTIKHSRFFFVGHKWNLVNGFVFVKLVFYVFLMWSIWCTDRSLDVFCKLNQSTKKWNNSGRINLLFPCPFGAWKNNSELIQLAKCPHLLIKTVYVNHWIRWLVYDSHWLVWHATLHLLYVLVLEQKQPNIIYL